MYEKNINYMPQQASLDTFLEIKTTKRRTIIYFIYISNKAKNIYHKIFGADETNKVHLFFAWTEKKATFKVQRY